MGFLPKPMEKARFFCQKGVFLHKNWSGQAELYFQLDPPPGGEAGPKGCWLEKLGWLAGPFRSGTNILENRPDRHVLISSRVWPGGVSQWGQGGLARPAYNFGPADEQSSTSMHPHFFCGATAP